MSEALIWFVLMFVICAFSVFTVDATRRGAEMKLYEMEVEL